MEISIKILLGYSVVVIVMVKYLYGILQKINQLLKHLITESVTNSKLILMSVVRGNQFSIKKCKKKILMMRMMNCIKIKKIWNKKMKIEIKIKIK